MERNLRKERIGVVVSNKMEKTIVVAVARKVKHPIYGKFVNKTTKFIAECLDESCKEGDTACCTFSLVSCAFWASMRSCNSFTESSFISALFMSYTLRLMIRRSHAVQ